jgi:potassium/hydrogen antiporter
VIDFINLSILIGSGLLVLSILTSLLSFRFGAPLLLIFLAVGLAAGEDGPGRIMFDNAPAAYLIGSIALAVILFESGLGTRVAAFRTAGPPAIALATVGVLVTAGIVALAAHYIFGLPWIHALLIGSIVSSTDAAAVFFLLRVGGITLRDRVRSTLEIESGSNDPIAIFLTIGIVETAVSGASSPTVIALVFLEQMGIGAVTGVAGGMAAVAVLSRLRMDPGLHAVSSLSIALFLFSATAVLGGSGFLAVYLAGLCVGNNRIPGGQTLQRFHQGLAWLAQIVMFVTLGLLATPSQFPAITPTAIGLALVLLFVARPVAVWLALLPFRFSRAEVLFIAWVGLRGAVSILLALVPILADLPGSRDLFNIAFLIVLMSLTVQGWTLRPLARGLRLIVPPRAGPVDRVDLELPGKADYELVAYRIHEQSVAARGRRLERWARPSLLVRDGHVRPPHAAGALQPGDLVYLFAPAARIPILDRLFGATREHAIEDRAFFGDLALRPDIRVVTLAELYGLPLVATGSDDTLSDLFHQRFGSGIEIGDRLSLGGVDLIVRDLDDGRILEIGVDLDPATAPSRRIPLFQTPAEIVRGLAGVVGRIRFRIWQIRERRRERHVNDVAALPSPSNGYDPVVEEKASGAGRTATPGVGGSNSERAGRE